MPSIRFDCWRAVAAGLGWHSDQPVEPTAGLWNAAPALNPRRYRIPGPPCNDGPQTRSELAELRELTRQRSAADIAQIHHWSTAEKSPLTHWSAVADEMAGLYGLTPPAGARIHALLSQAVCTAITACWAAKYRYRRPRPSDLDPEIDVSIIPVPRHPAYPAGHSTVAGAAAAILEQCFPQDAERFAGLAEASGISRLKAGIHYRSDHVAGLALGAAVARDLLDRAALDGGPIRWER